MPLARRTRLWLLAFALLAGVILAYQPAWNAGFIWDDDDYVTTNSLLTAPDGLRRIWFSFDSPSQYFPLVYTTFRIERALWGLEPSGYHWVNILFHAANALLLWRLLARLEIPGAWLAAALFALHPVQVESVAWVTELKNVQMGFFFLLALLCWVRFTEIASDRRWRVYVLSLVFYALALCSKTTACTLPAALVLLTWLRGERVGRRRLLEVTPYVALGIAMGLLTIWWERYHVGTHGRSFGIGFPERLLIASRAVCFYLGKLLWPANLTFSYPRWTISASDVGAYLWCVAACALGVLAWFARRTAGRGAWIALAYFVATLGPMLGFIMLYTFRYTFVADHYQYLACIGPIALAAAGVAKLSERAAGRSPLVVPGLCAVLLGGLAVLTWRQAGTYRDLETLWRVTLERNPASSLARANLGWKRSQEGRAEEAVAEYLEALRLDPTLPEVHHNLGMVLAEQGHVPEAIARYREAVRLNPLYADAHSDLGIALFQQGSHDEAIGHFREALRINPAHGDACYNLAVALTHLGRNAEAIAEYRRALRLNPGDADTYEHLANALLQDGQVAEARPLIERALEIQPDNPLFQIELAWILATAPQPALRDGALAVRLARQVSHASGGQDAIVLRTLAAAYAQTGQFSDAVQVAQRSLQLAESQSNEPLAGELRREIALYQAGRPFAAAQ